MSEDFDFEKSYNVLPEKIKNNPATTLAVYYCYCFNRFFRCTTGQLNICNEPPNTSSLPALIKGLEGLPSSHVSLKDCSTTLLDASSAHEEMRQIINRNRDRMEQYARAVDPLNTNRSKEVSDEARQMGGIPQHSKNPNINNLEAFKTYLNMMQPLTMLPVILKSVNDDTSADDLKSVALSLKHFYKAVEFFVAYSNREEFRDIFTSQFRKQLGSYSTSFEHLHLSYNPVINDTTIPRTDSTLVTQDMLFKTGMFNSPLGFNDGHARGISRKLEWFDPFQALIKETVFVAKTLNNKATTYTAMFEFNNNPSIPDAGQDRFNNVYLTSPILFQCAVNATLQALRKMSNNTNASNWPNFYFFP